MCRAFKLGGSGYYAWLERRRRGGSIREHSDQELVEAVKRVFKASKGRYGSYECIVSLKRKASRAAKGAWRD